VLVHLHAWRHGSGGPLRRVVTADERVVVLAGEDTTDRAVIVAADADPAVARRIVDAELTRVAAPGQGWLDVLGGVVVERDRLVPDDLPARLLVPLPPP
jgi:hypothetical protein